MITFGTLVKITDNSGAKWIKCLNLKKKKRSKVFLSIGEYFFGSIFKYKPHSKVQKKQKLTALIILSKENKCLNNGHFLKYEKTKAIILSDKTKDNCLGNRIKSRLARIFRKKKLKKKWSKLRSISKGFI